MKKIYFILLHMLSIIINFTIAFCVLFISQKYTLGFIPILKNTILFGRFYLYEILFTIISLIIIKKYITFETPYKKYLHL